MDGKRRRERAVGKSLVPYAATLLLLSAVIGLTCPRVRAAERNLSIGDFQTRTWTEKDGAPAAVWGMAQTNDGWLWFGGPNGLYRFDGIRFEEVKLNSDDSTRSNAVAALYAAPSGELVIGRSTGGVTILKNGKLTHYDDAATRQAGRLLDITQDAEGTIWATADNGVVRFAGDQWHIVGSEWGLPVERTFAVKLDRHDVLWVSTERSVLSLERGDRRFRPASLAIERGWSFAQSPDGRTWVTDTRGAYVLPGQTLTKPRDADETSRSSNGAFFDREGYYWDFDKKVGDGRPEPAIANIRSLEKDPGVALEDREGNIWISGAAAIHRLRRPTIERALNLRISSTALVAGASSSVWAGVLDSDVNVVADEGLWMFDGTPRHVQPGEIKLVSAMARDPKGAIWLGGPDGLWRQSADRFERAVALPEASRGQRVKGISPDCAGGLWVSVPPLGLLRHDGKAWRPNGDVLALPKEMPTVQACDAAGQLWLGYADGTVARVRNDQASIFGVAEGLQVGAVMSIGIGPRHLTVAGEHGLTIWQGLQIVTLTAADPRTLQRVTGIVETQKGDIYVNNTLGIARIAASDMKALPLSTAVKQVAVERFDQGDGYPGVGMNLPESGPSMTLSSDGRVWFAAREGIAWMDPSRANPRPIEPPVVIQALSAGEKRFENPDAASLSKGTRSVQIEYTALSYSHPERLRFRYRLEGLDEAWIEAGSKRAASYSNLGPGNYRFIVNATDETGAWTTNPASIGFEIPPTFMQSRTFLVACIAALAGLVYGAHWLRVRQLTSRERQLVVNRMQERARIARALHDTLLQGTQALILSVEAAASRVASADPARHMLDQALERADAVMTEGRDRIQDLRIASDVGADLSASLSRVGEELGRSYGILFEATVEGPVQPLTAVVHDEAYQIGREALLNAFQHARAKSIESQVIYNDDHLHLRVRDDGIGIDLTTAGAGTHAGHWGLQGMRERAANIGATVNIWSRVGAGTEVELKVPAEKAYCCKPRTNRWWRLRRMGQVRP